MNILIQILAIMLITIIGLPLTYFLTLTLMNGPHFTREILHTIKGELK